MTTGKFTEHLRQS